MTRETQDLHDADDEPLLPPPDKLYAHHRRQLSAMLDGELSPDEAKFMLRRLEHDTALAGCWERWQVCGDTLRGQRNALLPAGFAARVARALQDEDAAPAVVAVAAPRARIARWSGGAALAASVAVVALLVGRQLPADPAAMLAAGSVAATSTAAAPVSAMPASGLDGVEPAATAAAARSGRGTAGSALVASTGSADGGADRAVPDIGTAAVATSDPARAGRVAASRAATVVAVRSGSPSGAGVTPPRADRDVGAPVAAFAAAGFAPPDDAFTAAALPPSRPWPRAVLPGMAAADGFSVGYGRAGYGAAAPVDGFAPFEPRDGRALAPRLSADSLVAPADASRAADDAVPPRP